MDKWVIFIESHTKIALGMGLLIVAGYLFNKYEDHRHDEMVAGEAVAKKELADQIKINQDQATLVVQLQADYQKQAARLDKEINALNTEVLKQNQAAAHQQQIDATLPLAELAKRWVGLINMAEPEIQAAGENMSISGQAAHKTVEQLEMVEPLHNEVLAGHKIEDNLTAQLNSCNGVNKAQADQIAGMASQIQKADVACQKEISVIKSNARKSKFKYLIGGIVGGILMALKFGI